MLQGDACESVFVTLFGNTLLEGIVIIVSCHCHNSDMTLS